MADGATRASCSATVVPGSWRMIASTVSNDVARAIARAKVKRRLVLDRQQLRVRHHAHHLAGRRQHREVPHTAVEHVEQHLGPELVGRHGVRRRGHDLAQRRVAGQAGGDDAAAQVAVGDDAERAVGQRHHDRRRARGRRLAGCLAHRRVRIAQHRGPAQQRSDRALGVVDVARRVEPLLVERVELADDVAHPLRPGEQLAHRLVRQAVGERVLGGAEPDRGRQPGQHRRVAEHVALAQQVDRSVVDDHLDATPPHDPDGVERRRALRHDHRTGGEELDLRLRRDRLEVLGPERVEGCDGGEELRDVVHDDRSYTAPPARFSARRCMLRSCPSS